ncbi:MAG: flagellar biosynthesis anti-sigma factor FlgM [Nitrospirae bacterium]|nr:flagellar biosynthesis anti-sigma factor FlgM [Nitrospirota bacterium]
MKINGRNPTRSVNDSRMGSVQGERKEKAVQSAKSRSMEGDRVALSPEVSDFVRIKAEVDASPEIREELVLALKSEVENGTYHVPADQVAEKIVRETLLNAVGMN